MLSSASLLGTTTFVSSGVHATLTPQPLLPTSWHPVRLYVSSSDTPRTTRGTGAMISPLVGSSSLAMWCLMSLSSLSPPPPHRLPPLTSTSSRRVPLTRWPSHLYYFLQVLLHRGLRRHRVPARRPPVRPPTRCLTRVRWPRPSEWFLPQHLSRAQGRRCPFLRHPAPSRCLLRPRRASPSRCTSTSAGRGRSLLRHRGWPLICRRRPCLGRHQWCLLHRRHRHHRWSPLRRPRLLRCNSSLQLRCAGSSDCGGLLEYE